MASVSNLTLDIEVVNDGANLVANVTASYRINWSSYDQNSNQPYRESCVLIGDDTGITPPEDGTDDSIPNGTLFPQLLFPPFPINGGVTPVIGSPLIPVLNTTASNGAAFTDRVHSKTINLSNLDEDQDPVPNPDEIRAQVTMTPVLPAAVTRESAQFALNVG
jgi:hypothetical protein